jgi:hypothetical protein
MRYKGERKSGAFVSRPRSDAKVGRNCGAVHVRLLSEAQR